MSTALSWTELRAGYHDLAALLAFRASGLTPASRRRLRVVGAVVLLLTSAVVLGPAYLGGTLPRRHSGALLALLPSMCLGFLALAAFSAIASAGGREVVPREEAVAFPVSATADHLGALLLAPLNIAWLIQAWALLGSTAYVLGPTRLFASELPVLVWIVAATAVAQVVGWLAEGVRRGPRGIATFRLASAVLALGLAALLVAGMLSAVLDHSPTRYVLAAVLSGNTGHWLGWSLGVGGLLLLAAVAVVGGAVPARWALQRPMREELRLESGRHPARPTPRTDLAMMLRVDRAAVWRSVPLRRGLMLLALMPGLVALAGALEWRMLTVLPGLVASGGALLFGVNTWCLDGRGALWRDSLPVSSQVAFCSRAVVLLEVLLSSAALTLVLAALRAGRPTAPEVVALLCATLVVSVQVVAAAMRWSIAKPYAADLRSARATPAPPVMMAAYSARLALTTTLTGLVFSGLAGVAGVTDALLVRWILGAAVVFLLWSGWRLWRAGRRWADPVVRSRVVAVVSGS